MHTSATDFGHYTVSSVIVWLQKDNNILKNYIEPDQLLIFFKVTPGPLLLKRGTGITITGYK